MCVLVVRVDVCSWRAGETVAPRGERLACLEGALGSRGARGERERLVSVSLCCSRPVRAVSAEPRLPVGEC